jgi:hypothetical protein
MLSSQFKTQTKLKEFFRDIIHSVGVCESIKNKHPEYFLNFCEVFQRHPDYPEKFLGFIDIKIEHNPTFKNQLVVYIVKDSGETDDVSVLNSCITGKPKDNIKNAMRVAIQPRIDNYRSNHLIRICELCGDDKNIEIDHHSEKAPFAKLYHDFIAINTIRIPNTFDDTSGHIKCFKEVDNIFKESWIQFHEKNAILRMLCRKCNRTQQKYVRV